MHGIKINELSTGARPIKEVATSIIGLVATATAAAGAATVALDAAFPLNTPVLITSVRAAIDDAGTGGTLGAALAAISDQTSPFIVVVRVDEGEDAAELAANVIAGYQHLLTAESVVSVRPRILGSPGLDTAATAAALAIVARKLRAMAYVRPVGVDAATAILARAAFASRELMLIWPDIADKPDGDAVARALGLRARIDLETGWHKTLSNTAIDGISTGLTVPISFDLIGKTDDADLLNADDITTIVRQNGWRFWGNRTCSDDPLFAFESAVRTGQVLQDEIAAGLAWAVDKPMTSVLVKDILETINARFRALVAQGRMIGGEAWYDPDQNSEVNLSAGKLVIDYDYTPCAPLEALTLNQRITDRYYAGFADQLAN